MRGATKRALLVASVLALCGVLLSATAASADSSGGDRGDQKTFVCSGTPQAPGTIAPGTYGSVRVTGLCAVHGLVNIKGSLTIAQGAGLDATNDCNAHVNVGDGIRVLRDGILFFGNSFHDLGGGVTGGTDCAVNSNNIVHGGLESFNALAVVVHGSIIDDGVSLHGGGGGTSCAPVPGLPFPAFSTLEDSRINDGLSITGLSTCWLGTIHNQINGGVKIANNVLGDTDAIEFGANTIHGIVVCFGNHLDPSVPPDLIPADHAPNGAPTNFFDGLGPFPNNVNGKELGQCAGQ